MIAALTDALSDPAYRFGDHRDLMADYATEVGRRLGLGEEERSWLRYAVTLHELGKHMIPEHLLQRGSDLTPEEHAMLESYPSQMADLIHTVRFADLLKGIKLSKFVAPMVRHCRERWDGTGYPDGLAGETIPLGSRILAVVDAYQGLTMGRPPRAALAPEEAREELQRAAGSQFDPHVVEFFLQILTSPNYRLDSGGGQSISTWRPQ